MTPWKLKQARQVIDAGGVIAYPTEAVYGLGCDPMDERAVVRILEMKRRSVSKGLILVAADVQQILDFIFFSDEEMRDRVLATWPGPVTWLLPATALVPQWILGQHGTVAVRISRHPAIQSLCRLAGPLVSTSANPAGCAPARTPHRVKNYFGGSVDYILHGAPQPSQRQPTEIRDGLSGKIVRPSA